MRSRLLSASAALAVAAAFLAGSPRASADFVLDTFDNPDPHRIYQIDLLNGNPYTSPTDSVSPGVNRTIQVEVLTPLPPNFNSVSGQIGGGLFSMDTDNASKAASTLTYNLTGSAQNLAGTTALDLGFLNLDAGGSVTTIPVTVTINTATGTLTHTGMIVESANPFTKSFALSSFTGSGNLSQVNSITFALNGGSYSRTATDFALDNVRVQNPVPAPPAAILAGIGFLGLLGRSRWQRRSQA